MRARLQEVLGWPRPRFWVLAGVLGVLEVALAVAGRAGVLGAIGAVLTVLYAVLTAATGAAAKRRGERPGWAAALVGLIYGAIVSLPTFGQHVTMTSMKATLGKVAGANVTAAAVAQANSLTSHLSAWLIGVLLMAVLAIVLGSLGSTLVRAPAKAGPSAL